MLITEENNFRMEIAGLNRSSLSPLPKKQPEGRNDSNNSAYGKELNLPTLALDLGEK